MGERKQIAVILAGAVAKGAFEAGALAELVKEDVDIRSIVAASSGALNGTLLAASLHGAEDKSALVREVDALCSLWVEHGGAKDAFHLTLEDILLRRGASDQAGLLKLLDKNVTARPKCGERPELQLTIVVSPLGGVLDGPGSTFESARKFTNADFVSREALSSVFEAAVASASFPGAFAPSTVSDVGPCVDGGTVNNTPLKYAIEDKPIDTVVVIAPTPADARLAGEAVKDLHGLALIGRLADMLINERLHRDLREARETNDALRRLNDDPALRGHVDAIKTCLGWESRRPISICCIRPEQDLEGNAFSGFFHAELRAKYVEAGRKRARETIALGLPDMM